MTVESVYSTGAATGEVKKTPAGGWAFPRRGLGDGRLRLWANRTAGEPRANLGQGRSGRLLCIGRGRTARGRSRRHSPRAALPGQVEELERGGSWYLSGLRSLRRGGALHVPGHRTE